MSLSDKIEELKGDDLANWYKEHEEYLDNLSSMEICNENHNCNDFVINKLKEKISKDIKEAIKELKEIDWDDFENSIYRIHKEIDKIFGDALVNKSERGFKNGKNN